MPSRSELKKISTTRFKEAVTLYDNGLYDGAKYLSGYVIETALKARICKILDSDYPESADTKSFLTHKFDTLVKLGGLQKMLDDELNRNVIFKSNWSLVTTSWTEAYRYKPIGTSSEKDVQDIINAIQDDSDGILTWIKTKW